MDLLNDGLATLTPSHDDSRLDCIDYALRFKGIIVSNDSFNDVNNMAKAGGLGPEDRSQAIQKLISEIKTFSFEGK